MDAFSILGIRENPKQQSDLVRLYKRSAKLQAYYWQKGKREDSKRVKWAFETVQKASGLKLPEKRKPAKTEEGAAAAGADGAPGPATPAADEEQLPPAEARKRKAQSLEEERREAIRQKMQARRQNSGNAADEKAKRQEEIKERLAVKRLVKKVPVRSEDECKKAIATFVPSAPASGEDVADRGRFALLCPVSIERIKTAARGVKCQHLQCFDLEAFLMSKSKACPICGAALESPTDLSIDAYLTSVISQIADDAANEIFVATNGTWRIAEAQASEESSEEGLGDLGNPMMFAATPGTPFSPMAEVEEEETLDERDRRITEEFLAEEAARTNREERAAAIVAAKEKALADAAARAARRKTTKEKAAADAKQKADEEKKMKAILQFVPKTRAVRPQGDIGSRGAAPTAAPGAAAASVAEDEGPPPRLGTEDDASYVVVELERPLGIVFQANARPWGGVAVREFDDDGAAATHGRLRLGDQLVGADHHCTMGLDADACIGLISGSRSKTVKVTFFRGEARHLYGRHRPGEAWVTGLLKRVGDGSLRPAPPLERKAAGEKQAAKLAAAVAEGGSENEEVEEAFSSDEAAALPAALTACIQGDGLDADLSRCSTGLEDFEGADGSLPRAVLRACIDANETEWSSVKSQDDWRQAALRRLAAVVRGEG